jgi:hypothetical protein
MDANSLSADLLARCRRPAGADTDAILTEILESSDTAGLRRIAEDGQADALFRRAALDRCVRLGQGKAGEDPLTWLPRLAGVEVTEEVRFAAFHWCCELSPAQDRTRGAAVRTRGAVHARGGARTGRFDWREAAAKDPSPRIRELAVLGAAK